MEIYCLDTNVFVQAWKGYYPHSLCPSYWDILEKLAEERRVFICEQVYQEIKRQDDELSEWLKDRRDKFVWEFDEATGKCLSEIMLNHKRITMAGSTRSAADPFVIAHAQSYGAIVVSKETFSNSPQKKPRIPDVCKAIGVECIDDHKMVQEVGISFKATMKQVA